MGERLHLLQRRLRLAVLPLRQFLEAGREVLLRKPRTLTRLADERRIDGHAGHATASLKRSFSVKLVIGRRAAFLYREPKLHRWV